MFVVRDTHLCQSCHFTSVINTGLITCVVHMRGEGIWLGVARVCHILMDEESLQ